MTKAFNVERKTEIFNAIREKSLPAKDIANKLDIISWTKERELTILWNQFNAELAGTDCATD